MEYHYHHGDLEVCLISQLYLSNKILVQVGSSHRIFMSCQCGARLISISSLLEWSEPIELMMDLCLNLYAHGKKGVLNNRRHGVDCFIEGRNR